MNLLLFSAQDRCGDKFIRVDGRRLEHIRQVHRASLGDSLRVGEINGQMGSGEIIELDTDSATLLVELNSSPPPKLPLTLIVALPRPKMLRRIVRSAAEFGVAQLHFIHSYRVEKSYWQTPVLHPNTLREYLLQGLEQARDTQLPPVFLHRRFKPFCEDELPALCEKGLALVAHPGEQPPCPRGIDEPCSLVIGPEGGFIPYEIEKLQQAGCQPVSLGPRILRVENAVTGLISRLY